MIVAVDGPAGAGKSTVARALARRLDFNYLDTGAMYRCFALLVKRHGQEGAVSQDPELLLGEQILLDGEDVSELIRSPEISQLASKIASEPLIRERLTQQQRRIMGSGDWVAEGRDIGTVVAPQAELKIFLTASEKERARRRAQQLGLPFEEVLKQQLERDRQDQTRTHSPLVKANDAVELITDGLSLEEVVNRVAALVGAIRGSEASN